jgi:glycosyltransferase involved in cell wall biosynthesis
MKRALLIGPLPPPIGGSEVLTLNVSRSAQWGAHGIELECIDTSPGDRVRAPEEALGPGDVLRGIRVFRELAAKVDRFDAVLLWANHRFIVTAGLAIIAWSRLRGKPVFVKMFGATLARQIRRMPAPWRRLALAQLRRCECVFPETNGLAGELVEEGWLPEARVVVLPNFLPDVSFSAPRTPKRFSGKCVFIGQVKREKGVFDIVEALGKGGRGSCDFYGPIIPRDREVFLEAVSRRPNLSYKGLLEPSSVIATAASYDVMLLPTYHSGEGYPAAILEAYAAGIPVITTRWLYLPEIVEDRTRGLLVPTESPASIAEAIDSLFADQALYESMCANAQSFVRRFSERSILGGIFIPRVLRALR